MAETYPFNENAKALLKRLQSNDGSTVNPALALAAVEAALREAYSQGQRATHPPAQPAREPKQPPPPARHAPPVAASDPEPECAHQWEETFLDGRAVGSKCLKCDVLERDVQNRCDHFYVKTGAGEICVACRKSKFAR
jgi:hypothetical protein